MLDTNSIFSNLVLLAIAHNWSLEAIKVEIQNKRTRVSGEFMQLQPSRSRREKNSAKNIIIAR